MPADVETLRVRVRPNARVSALVRGDDGGWTATLKSPPVDGKANAELIGLVADAFGVPKASVQIRTGAGSRLKTVRVVRRVSQETELKAAVFTRRLPGD